MFRRPPGSTRLTHSFPTRRSSDLILLLDAVAVLFQRETEARGQGFRVSPQDVGGGRKAGIVDQADDEAGFRSAGIAEVRAGQADAKADFVAIGIADVLRVPHAARHEDADRIAGAFLPDHAAIPSNRSPMAGSSFMRSEERGVGKECVRKVRSWWWP